MKRRLLLFFAGVLGSALCAGFVACNELQGQKDIGTLPVPVSDVSDEVSAFFDENLHRMDFSDILETSGYVVNRCVMINSEEGYRQLNSKDDTPSSLPDIDFDKYTLMIGYFSAAYAGLYTVDQSVVVGSKEITMRIHAKLLNGGYTYGSTVRFWGLYPKLPQLPVNINVIEK